MVSNQDGSAKYASKNRIDKNRDKEKLKLGKMKAYSVVLQEEESSNKNVFFLCQKVEREQTNVYCE